MSSNSRAVRYRRLALAEPDPEKSKLRHLIADEADRAGNGRVDDAKVHGRTAEGHEMHPLPGH
jgi:hypothetical protein